MLFVKYLKEISKNNVFLLKPLRKNNILQNPIIFGYNKISNLKDYRYVFLGKLYKQKLKLESIFLKIKKDKEKIGIDNYKILKNEIHFIYKKIDFLKNVYDFEANKLNPKYEVSYPELDYDYYNKRFFGVTKADIGKNLKIVTKDEKTKTFLKKDIIDLLEYTKKEVVGFDYKFGEYVFMSHGSGILYIPTKKTYSLREVITLFFHEMTHFFRRYNSIRNFGTHYGFSDYMIIEEGFALYNEYDYGKKLIPNISYNPYYDLCYFILLDDNLTEEDKKNKIYEILKVKGFSKTKSMHYYYRFHRYSSFGSGGFFLKDLIYTKGYKKVKKLIKENPDNYDIIISGRIGPSCIKKGFYKTENNFDVKSYFDDILLNIKKKL